MSNEFFKSEIFSWIKTIVITVAIALFIKTFLFSSTRVEGHSMEPTFTTGDRVITSKITYRVGDPKRDDVIIFQAPDDPKKDYIKRVIGLPGDFVEIKDGKVYVNNKQIIENYTQKNVLTDTYGYDKWNVTEGYIFVLGDNRNPGASKDSRSIGLVNEDKIVGKAVFRYFPFDRFKTF